MRCVLPNVVAILILLGGVLSPALAMQDVEEDSGAAVEDGTVLRTLQAQETANEETARRLAKASSISKVLPSVEILGDEPLSKAVTRIPNQSVFPQGGGVRLTPRELIEIVLANESRKRFVRFRVSMRSGLFASDDPGAAFTPSDQYTGTKWTAVVVTADVSSLRLKGVGSQLTRGVVKASSLEETETLYEESFIQIASPDRFVHLETGQFGDTPAERLGKSSVSEAVVVACDEFYSPVQSTGRSSLLINEALGIVWGVGLFDPQRESPALLSDYLQRKLDAGDEVSVVQLESGDLGITVVRTSEGPARSYHIQIRYDPSVGRIEQVEFGYDRENADGYIPEPDSTPGDRWMCSEQIRFRYANSDSFVPNAVVYHQLGSERAGRVWLYDEIEYPDSLDPDELTLTFPSGTSVVDHVGQRFYKVGQSDEDEQRAVQKYRMGHGLDPPDYGVPVLGEPVSEATRRSRIRRMVIGNGVIIIVVATLVAFRRIR